MKSASDGNAFNDLNEALTNVILYESTDFLLICDGLYRMENYSEFEIFQGLSRAHFS